MIKNQTHTLVDHLFRHEYGKMVALLSGGFGIIHLDKIEDAVQESFHKALQSWPVNGMPKKPTAWLYRVSKNQLIDYLRKKKGLSLESIPDIHMKADNRGQEFFHDNEMSDYQLRLIFSCCHPLLNSTEQIALTLKTISGFSIAEIANALISKESRIKKVLHRARQKIRFKQVKFEIPVGAELSARIDAVISVLYLLFNEGYYSTKNETLIRKELCAEAMRLTKIIDEHPSCQNTDSKALLALMCYHSARFESRYNESNDIVLLNEQNRELWNKDLIHIGHLYMDQAIGTEPYSVYHVEAAIAAEHCRTPSFEQTRWEHLLILYELLEKVKNNPVVRLNKAVILCQLNRLDEALYIIHDFENMDWDGRTYLFHLVAAEVFKQLNEFQIQKKYLELAKQSSKTQSELRLVQRKLTQISQA